MKKVRQNKILELVKANEIETQEELVELLRKEGFDVTQATVSRDIKILRLSKMPAGDGRQKYTVLETVQETVDEKFVRVLRDGFISMDTAQNILVIKTGSGMAMAVAAALDALKFPEVVGSIAGDDTIMAAVRTVEDADRLMKKIQNMIG